MDIFQRAMAISFAAATNRDIETAAQINEEIRAGGEKSARMRPTSARRPRRLLTIHRYNPQHDLGSGMGILDFRRDPIKALIERGFQDAIRHDCATSGCVIGESSAPPN
jgi:hypothetical protein